VAARVVVLDYGSGNVRSAVRMLERVGARVDLSADDHVVRFRRPTVCSCRAWATSTPVCAGCVPWTGPA
jgi:Glutamine amidotransferase